MLVKVLKIAEDLRCNNNDGDRPFVAHFASRSDENDASTSEYKELFANIPMAAKELMNDFGKQRGTQVKHLKDLKNLKMLLSS